MLLTQAGCGLLLDPSQTGAGVSENGEVEEQNGEEIRNGTNAVDSDGDGLSDERELSPPPGTIATDPNNPDTDEDGSNDGEDPAPTVAGCKEELLFFDDFRENARDRWATAKGDWAEQDGDILASTNEEIGGAVTWIGERDWRNYDVQVRMRLDTDEQGEGGHDGGFIFRSTEVSDVNNGGAHYYLGLYPEQNRVSLGIMDGQWKPFANEDQDIETDRWYELRVRARGASLRIFLDGEEIIETQDNIYLEGSIGLRTFLSKTSYDHVIVCR